MSGLIRPHQLSDNDALNRRRLWENYLDAAKRLSQMSGWALGDDTLKRQDFKLHAWMELLTVQAEELNYRTPQYGYVVPDALLEVVHDDALLEGKFRWSLDVKPSASTKMIVAWPVLNGQAVWGSLDYLQVDQLIEYPGVAIGAPAVDPSVEANEASLLNLDNTYSLNLGNVGQMVGQNGRSHFAVMLRSIGDFTVKKCVVSFKKVLR